MSAHRAASPTLNLALHSSYTANNNTGPRAVGPFRVCVLVQRGSVERRHVSGYCGERTGRLLSARDSSRFTGFSRWHGKATASSPGRTGTRRAAGGPVNATCLTVTVSHTHTHSKARALRSVFPSSEWRWLC